MSFRKPTNQQSKLKTFKISRKTTLKPNDFFIKINNKWFFRLPKTNIEISLQMKNIILQIFNNIYNSSNTKCEIIGTENIIQNTKVQNLDIDMEQLTKLLSSNMQKNKVTIAANKETKSQRNNSFIKYIIWSFILFASSKYIRFDWHDFVSDLKEISNLNLQPIVNRVTPKHAVFNGSLTDA